MEGIFSGTSRTISLCRDCSGTYNTISTMKEKEKRPTISGIPTNRRSILFGFRFFLVFFLVLFLNKNTG